MKGKIDPATIQGINNAFSVAWPLVRAPLLIDKAADNAFSTMVDRLRGEPGPLKGGKA